MIPLYALQAVGGKVYSLDDAAVVKDAAALDGTGGVAFVPYYITSPLRHARDKGWNKLRRVLLMLAHAGDMTARVTAFADGRESGFPITRSLAIGAAGILNVPANEAGSGFSYRVELTEYSAEVAFSDAEAYVVGHRSFR